MAPKFVMASETCFCLSFCLQAGASLESLAKGAVQFSRRFTVRELQDRWHSLLYDPVISAEASARMIAIELSASTLPSKFNRFGNSKENKSVSGKRKAGSVRSCYYALRKRICHDLNSMDLSFLVAPGDGNYIGHGDEPLSGDPISDHFGLQGSNLDLMHHVFPQNLMDSGTATSGTVAAAHAFDPGFQHPVEENFHIEQDNIHKEIPHLFAENPPFTGNSSAVEELGQPKKLPAHNLFKSDDLGAEPLSTFDRLDTDPGNICSEFESNQVFNSPMSECGASFHNLEFSSPLHGIPIWRTVEGIAEPSMPVDVGLREKGSFKLPDDDDAKNATTSGYDGHLDSKVKIEMPYYDGLRSPTASAEGYLAELSNSLLNFTNEEELLFMDVDGKDVIDKSYYDGLSSLLLNSPIDVSQDLTPNITEPDTSVAPDMCLRNPSIACPGELEDNRGSRCGDGHIAQDSGAQMLSSLPASNSQFPDPSESVCVLNTEHPEIPCNDDFIPPNQQSPSSVSYVAQKNFKGANNPTSSNINDISGNQRTHERGLILTQREGKNTGECRASSKTIGSHVLTEVGINHPVGDGVKFELPNSDYRHVASRGVGVVCGGSNHINSANLSTDSLRPSMLKEEMVEVSPTKYLNQTDSLIKRPSLGSDSLDGCTQTNASAIKQELDVPATIREYQSSAEMGPVDIAVSEPVGNPPISDLEELPVESDDDVPHYSDIEAMVNAITNLIVDWWIF
jgi:hypothetical protein